MLAAMVPLACLIAPARGQEAAEPIGDVLVTPALTPQAGETLEPAGEWSGRHVEGGAGLYFMRPFFESNPAYSASSSRYSNPYPLPLMPPVLASLAPSGGVPANVQYTLQKDFSTDFEVAPRVWLGYVSPCGFGVRGRYWYYHEGSSETAVNAAGPEFTQSIVTSATVQGLSVVSYREGAQVPNGPEPVDILGFGRNLDMHVADLEVTRDTQAGSWYFLFSVGARYAHLTQHYNVFFASPNMPNIYADDLNSDVLLSEHTFSGAGPTAAIEVRRPAVFGFALYAGARGSILFGTTEQQASLASFSYFATPTMLIPSRAANYSSVCASHDDVLPVAELEAGFEWSHQWGRVRPFLQTGLVAQSWFGAGSASSTTGNFGLLGLSVLTGLDF
jgi:hypothetical protein